MGANNHVSVVLPNSSHVKSLGSNPPSQEREDEEEEGKEIFLKKEPRKKLATSVFSWWMIFQ